MDRLNLNDLNVILLGLDEYQITVNLRRTHGRKGEAEWATDTALIASVRGKIERRMDRQFSSQTARLNKGGI